jgi:hypothetical protein
MEKCPSLPDSLKTHVNEGLGAFLHAHLHPNVRNLVSSVERGNGIGLLKKLQTMHASADAADRAQALQQLYELQMHDNKEPFVHFISRFRNQIQFYKTRPSTVVKCPPTKSHPPSSWMNFVPTVMSLATSATCLKCFPGGWETKQGPDVEGPRHKGTLENVIFECSDMKGGRHHTGDGELGCRGFSWGMGPPCATIPLHPEHCTGRFGVGHFLHCAPLRSIILRQRSGPTAMFETAFEHRGSSGGFSEVCRVMAGDICSIDAESDLAGRNHVVSILVQLFVLPLGMQSDTIGHDVIGHVGRTRH